MKTIELTNIEFDLLQDMLEEKANEDLNAGEIYTHPDWRAILSGLEKFSIVQNVDKDGTVSFGPPNIEVK